MLTVIVKIAKRYFVPLARSQERAGVRGNIHGESLLS